MKRGVKLAIALFVLTGCIMFAAALAGGLMDDSAFTSAARDATH